MKGEKQRRGVGVADDGRLSGKRKCWRHDTVRMMRSIVEEIEKEGGSLALGELKVRMGVSDRVVYALVERLADEGYVEKSHGANDARTRTVHVTGKHSD
jgi:DNA-binding MarR family transcriptional regulator